ncbi:MAG TPA: hypothetical protein VGI81_14155 [Tepidisphaeraceae bacterium]|jgi:hypothetical protein
MTAIITPQRRIWTPADPFATVCPNCGKRVRRAADWLRRKRAWLRRRLLDPLALFAAGDGFVDSSGNDVIDASGNDEVDGGAGTCCLFQARDCPTSALRSLYVPKSKIVAAGGVYYFESGGVCYSASLSDPAPCNSTPLVTGETAVTSCSDSACSSPTCPSCQTTPSTFMCTGWAGGFPCGNSTVCANPNSLDWDGTLVQQTGNCNLWVAPPNVVGGVDYFPSVPNQLVARYWTMAMTLDCGNAGVIPGLASNSWGLVVFLEDSCGTISYTISYQKTTPGGTPPGTYLPISGQDGAVSTCGATSPTLTIA